MNTNRCFPLILAAALLCGCQTMAADEEGPARIIDADEASRAALQAALRDALGRDVLLADTALTDSSRLIIEVSPPRTMENPAPAGLELRDPLQFQLVKSGDDCILVNMQDDSRRVLADTRCMAE